MWGCDPIPPGKSIEKSFRGWGIQLEKCPSAGFYTHRPRSSKKKAKGAKKNRKFWDEPHLPNTTRWKFWRE